MLLPNIHVSLFNIWRATKMKWCSRALNETHRVHVVRNRVVDGHRSAARSRAAPVSCLDARCWKSRSGTRAGSTSLANPAAIRTRTRLFFVAEFLACIVHFFTLSPQLYLLEKKMRKMNHHKKFKKMKKKMKKEI